MARLGSYAVFSICLMGNVARTGTHDEEDQDGSIMFVHLEKGNKQRDRDRERDRDRNRGIAKGKYIQTFERGAKEKDKE